MKVHTLDSDTDASLKTYFFETIFPKERYGQIFLVIVVLKALSYWIISKWQHPIEPLSVIAVYRVGDIQYYPSISALSNFNFGENAVFERLGEGFIHCPLASIFPYALGLFLFGVTGFIITDIIIALCYYVILAILLKLLNIPKILSECISLLVVTEALNPLLFTFRTLYRMSRIFRLSVLAILGVNALLLGGMVILLFLRRKNSLPQAVLQLGLISTALLMLLSSGPVRTPVWWYWRIPRPFVTEVFSLLCICFICALLNPGKLSNQKSFWLLWGLLGISVAALLLSDPYSTVITLLSIFFVMCYFFSNSLRSYEDRIQYVKGMIIFGVTALIGSIPFLSQRLFEHPDVLRRHGLFPLNRMNVLFFQKWATYFTLGVAFICGVFLLELFRQHDKEKTSTSRQNYIVLLVVFCFAACIALPVSGIVFGKGIQLYHFLDRFRKYFSFTAIIFFLYTLLLVPEYFPKYLKWGRQHVKPGFRKLTTFLISCVVVFSLLSTVRYAYLLSQKNTHVRDDFEEYSFLAHYRTDFLGLVNELLLRKHEGSRVIGTFDHQLYSWWVSFEKGYSFVPDPGFSTVSDEEIEYRLIRLCKILGMDAEAFRTFINKDYVNHFWLGHNKYKVSKIYAFAPMSDYTPKEVQGKIEEAGVLGGELAIPKSEQDRLVKQFENLEVGLDNPRLDLIVLTNDEYLKSFSPPPETFTCTYKNSTFRVWTRYFDD